uniref:NADH dehydrogenase subunit 2 n=1 Tax=Allodiplogaster sudhausi TaxID=2761625 RepID=A0A0U2PZE7_9BILA|nr:NADH dehydrogenase subunit 2 [Allodiplogaster sudhausi]ALT06538.1 NADH dehydrogenase subunit 2 [Allodiplogaster sudhausi]
MIWMVLVLILSLISFIMNNYLVWWSIFLLMTIIFLLIMKNSMNFSNMILYFVLQESMGLLFLLVGLSLLQFIIILLKTGVAPFHFWIFSVMNGMSGMNLLWFLTFQKFPFLIIMMQLFIMGFIIVIILGIIFCYCQIFLSKNYTNMILLSSTESFNWLLLCGFLSFFNVLYLFMYYIILMIFIIINMQSLSLGDMSWELVLVFLNMPFMVTFFVKMFSLSSLLLFNNMMLLLLLFMMFLSVLSFGFMLVNMSMNMKLNYQSKLNSLIFMLIPFSMVLLL